MRFSRPARPVLPPGKCSALITVTADLGELLVGHSTWDSYTAALRIYKHYELQLADSAVVTRRMSFSSYPGARAQAGRHGGEAHKGVRMRAGRQACGGGHIHPMGR